MATMSSPNFRCPLCGSQYFGSVVQNGVPTYGYCKGPEELAPAPGGGYFSLRRPCTFRWDRQHDAAVARPPPTDGN